MTDKPLTFYIHLDETTARIPHVRIQLWNDYAAAGAKYIVLSDELLRQFCGNGKLVPEIRAEIEPTGLKFVDGHAPFGPWENYCLPDESARPSMIARQKLALQLCADFDVHTITAHIGGIPPIFFSYPAEHFIESTFRTLDELLPLAEKLDVTIAIENSWTPITTPERLLEVVRRYDSPRLGICYDSGHANLMAHPTDDPEAAAIKTFGSFGLPVPWDDRILEKVLPEVVNCHLHDNDGLVDRHQLPGLGNIDWPHVMGLLEKAPRLRCVQDEAYPHKYGYFSTAENVRVFTDLMEGKYPERR